MVLDFKNRSIVTIEQWESGGTALNITDKIVHYLTKTTVIFSLKSGNINKNSCRIPTHRL